MPPGVTPSPVGRPRGGVSRLKDRSSAQVGSGNYVTTRLAVLVQNQAKINPPGPTRGIPFWWPTGFSEVISLSIQKERKGLQEHISGWPALAAFRSLPQVVSPQAQEGRLGEDVGWPLKVG